MERFDATLEFSFGAPIARDGDEQRRANCDRSSSDRALRHRSIKMLHVRLAHSARHNFESPLHNRNTVRVAATLHIAAPQRRLPVAVGGQLPIIYVSPHAGMLAFDHLSARFALFV